MKGHLLHLRTPTDTPGRRYSYHRAILLVAGCALLATCAFGGLVG